MKMVCMKCRRVEETSRDYCNACSCPEEGIWQMLRPYDPSSTATRESAN
jgi:hypothetical protein